jgi:predicted amidophosphoribosyltransferase
MVRAVTAISTAIAAMCLLEMALASTLRCASCRSTQQQSEGVCAGNGLDLSESAAAASAGLRFGHWTAYET